MTDEEKVPNEPTDENPVAETEEKKDAEDADAVRSGLEALGRYDEMGRFRIKWESLISFIGDLLKGFGFEIDLNDREALGRAMDEARKQANLKKDLMLQLREAKEEAEARAAAALEEVEKLKAQLAELEQKYSSAQEEIQALKEQLEAARAEMDALRKEMEEAVAAAKQSGEAAAAAVAADKDALIEGYIDRIAALELEVDKYRGLSLDEMAKVEAERDELAARVADFEQAMGVDDPRRKLADALSEIRRMKQVLKERDWALDQFNITPEPYHDEITAAIEKLRKAGAPPEALNILDELASMRYEALVKLREEMNAGQGSYAVITDLVLEAGRLKGLCDALGTMAGN